MFSYTFQNWIVINKSSLHLDNDLIQNGIISNNTIVTCWINRSGVIMWFLPPDNREALMVLCDVFVSEQPLRFGTWWQESLRFATLSESKPHFSYLWKSDLPLAICFRYSIQCLQQVKVSFVNSINCSFAEIPFMRADIWNFYDIFVTIWIIDLKITKDATSFTGAIDKRYWLPQNIKVFLYAFDIRCSDR